MEFRLLPRLLLWSMLIIACLGTVSSLIRPERDQTPAYLQIAQEQQMAIQTAAGFAREWMTWNGGEAPEVRASRLKPYVNPEALGRIAPIQTEQKGSRQDVIASEFMSLVPSSGSSYTVRVRVTVTRPDRAVWELDIPVWAKAGRGAAVTAQPLIRPLAEPTVVPEQRSAGSSVSAEVKQRMRPVIESFLKAMCEGKDAGSLANYVTSGASLAPLEGRIRYLALERLDASGAGPYTVSVTFSAKDEATGFRITQIWKLKVTEENGKFFVGGISV